MPLPSLEDRIVFIAGGKSYNGEAGLKQMNQLGDYYATHGSDPVVVADGIVAAVTQGCVHLLVGSKAKITERLKRVSPALVRKLAMKTAVQIGYA